jgi:hypothetical protein
MKIYRYIGDPISIPLVSGETLFLLKNTSVEMEQGRFDEIEAFLKKGKTGSMKNFLLISDLETKRNERAPVPREIIDKRFKSKKG